jgi:hypothetical protein
MTRSFHNRLKRLEVTAAIRRGTRNTQNDRFPGQMGKTNDQFFLEVFEWLIRDRGTSGQKVQGELKQKIQREIAALRLALNGACSKVTKRKVKQ